MEKVAINILKYILRFLNYNFRNRVFCRKIEKNIPLRLEDRDIQIGYCG